MPRLGVVGTMVWDTIHPPGADSPTEAWGGIAYSLSAFGAAAGVDWEMFPIVHVGADLAEPARRFLRQLDGIESLDGVRVVPEPNNRVKLYYHEPTRRCEHLSGGVPGWDAQELWPLARGCDALYVNFIAGWEMNLEAARGLRKHVGGPVYADLHSLLLSVGPDGVRALRPLDAWREWLACFDVVQLNEDEFATLTGAPDPAREVTRSMDSTPRAVLVTRGAAGATWYASERTRQHGLVDPVATSSAAPVTSGRVQGPPAAEEKDPTGCGDVWGMACCAALLDGLALEPAMERANTLARLSVGFSGAEGLGRALRSGWSEESR